MARKLPGLRRELDARALFSTAYGEIASSIYFALGVIAFHALGFTPLVLLAAGLLFLLVAVSYAEAVTAMKLEATVSELQESIHAHPTLSEVMGEAAWSVTGSALNA